MSTFEMQEFLWMMFSIHDIEKTEANYKLFSDLVENQGLWNAEERIWKAGKNYHREYCSE